MLSLRNAVPAILAVLISACGSSTPSGSNQCPSSNPDCASMLQPSPSATANASIGASSTTISFNPISGGFGATITLPAATAGAGATLNATLSATPPKGLPPASASYNPLAYIAFTVSQTVTLNGTFSVTLNYTGSAPPGPYYIAFYNGSAWEYDVAGPISPQNGSVTATFSTNGPLTLSPGVTYGLALTTK
jgi:hypothetical protein